jgi:hypothetical protein
MVEDLFKLNGNADITIIDNASTYEPLINWYKEVENDIKIIRHDTNRGPWVFFHGRISSTINSEYYVYSDADLEVNPNMPYNWQEIMVDYIKKYNRKASLVLRIDDIPNHYEFKNTILDHQNICWGKTDEANVYLAVTDMTFTLDQKNKGYRYESVRIGGDFAARHIPWYIDFNNISPEELYYLEHINTNFNDALYSNKHLKKIRDMKNI